MVLACIAPQRTESGRPQADWGGSQMWSGAAAVTNTPEMAGLRSLSQDFGRMVGYRMGLAIGATFAGYTILRLSAVT